MSDQNEHSQTSQKPKREPLQVPNLKHVYTISCGMPARHFFNLLKKYNNPLVIDTRRSRYTRGGGFASEADIEYICEVHDIAYAHVLELAPTKEMREAFHKVAGPTAKSTQVERAEAWTTFLHAYMSRIGGTLKVLRTGGPLRTIIEGTHEGIVILCACGHHKDCHRQVTAGMLEKWVEGVSVKHLYADEVGGNSPRLKSPRRYLLRDIPNANIIASPPRGRRS
jgi:hypothetical protein